MDNFQQWKNNKALGKKEQSTGLSEDGKNVFFFSVMALARVSKLTSDADLSFHAGAKF
jgi:hypothetical protein